MNPKKIIISVSALLIVGVLAGIHPSQAAITSFTDPRVVYLADKSVLFGVKINGDDIGSGSFYFEIGTASGNNNVVAEGNGGELFYPVGNEYYYLISETENRLLPSTTYYARVVSVDDQSIISPEITFTTKASKDLTIEGISPVSGPIGTEVTIRGSGFGTLLSGGVVYFGNCSIIRSSSGCGEIISWADTQIVVKVISGTNGSISGPVGIRKELKTEGSGTAYRLVKVLEGPVFTITQVSTNTNQAVNTNQATNGNVNQATNGNTNITANVNTGIANDNTNTVATANQTVVSDSSGKQIMMYVVAALVIAGVLIYMAIQLRRAKKQ